MDTPHRLAARLVPASLAAAALIAFAGPAHAATPTSYAGDMASAAVPATAVDLEISPGPTAGGGSGRRVR